jgi:hypothetical protein
MVHRNDPAPFIPRNSIRYMHLVLDNCTYHDFSVPARFSESETLHLVGEESTDFDSQFYFR